MGFAQNKKNMILSLESFFLFFCVHRSALNFLEQTLVHWKCWKRAMKSKRGKVLCSWLAFYGFTALTTVLAASYFDRFVTTNKPKVSEG